MHSPLALVAFALVITLASSSPLRGAQISADDSSVAGDSRGDSTCVVRESACHDEDSLYHVSKLADKPGWFSMKLDKMVDGKPVTMGTVECSYDSAKRGLTCEFARGVFHLAIEDNKMTGTMKLTDGTLWRKLTLKKSAQ